MEKSLYLEYVQRFFPQLVISIIERLNEKRANQLPYMYKTLLIPDFSLILLIYINFLSCISLNYLSLIYTISRKKSVVLATDFLVFFNYKRIIIGLINSCIL